MTQQQIDEIATLTDRLAVISAQIALLEANFNGQKNQLDRQIAAIKAQIETVQKAAPDTKLLAGPAINNLATKR